MEYKYWEIYIHKNQGYLGRCIVWCKTDHSLKISPEVLKGVQTKIKEVIVQ